VPRVRSTLPILAATAFLVAAFVASGAGASPRVPTGSRPAAATDPARRVTATVGEPTSIPLTDSPEREVQVTGLPDGANVVDRAIVWTPRSAGEWTAVVRAGRTGNQKVALTTRAGVGTAAGTTIRRITLVSRYPARPGAIVAMGDSVAAGQGLQLTDYFGGDSCWRAGDRNYPRRILPAWTKLHPGTPTEVATVACSGFDSGDLMDAGVKGGVDGTGPSNRQLPQLEWAVRANPGLVTITVGANDLHFDRPEQSLHRDGTVNRGVVDQRLRSFGRNLAKILDRLLARTDARIVVTTYGDPAAAHPEGVGNCRDACFAHAVTDIVGRLDDRIVATVAATGSARVSVADVRTAFVGHGAPNGVGPDALRLGTRLGPTVQGASAFCAIGHPGGDPWINPIDCVHPNAAGTRAYADAVTATFTATAA
jgi:lysophospholipase L1-like esterase